MKKLLSLLLALTLVVSLVVPAIAADGDAAETITTVEQLKDAAAKGGTYELGADIAVDEGITIEAGKELTLDLAGKTIARNTEAAVSSAAITNNGNLTIKDSVGGGKITAFAQNPDTAEIPYYANNTITNCGVLTVQGGTIENSTSDAARAAFPIDNNSTIRDAITNIEGGTITGRGAIRVYANSNTHKSELNITGGTVAGSSYGVWVQNPGSSDPKAALNIAGGTVGKVLLSPGANFDIAITDGAVAEIAIWEADTTNVSRNPAAFITGGTFTVEPDAAFVADNCIITNVDGKYVVSVDYAATINRDGKAETYLTLEEAVAAAAEGETITLLKDVVLSEILKIEKALTIVGAEKAGGMYSITGNGKNSSNTYKTLEVYADLTLKNVEVINNKGAGRPVDMRNDGITLNVINSKLTATSAANNQLITVGGNGKGSDGVAGKTVVNVSGSQLTAGVAGYGIISFNPAEINITDASVSTGYNALYMKGISNSLGSEGSVINVKGSTLETFNNSTNPASGNFGLFVTEDENITLNVDADSTLKVEAKGAVSQYLIMNKAGSSNVNIEPCTWMLIGDNAKVLGGAAGLTDSTLKFPSGDATKYQLRKCGYDYMAISEDQVLVIDAHERVNAPENDIFAHEVKKVETQDPTCTAEGWTAYEHCTVCDYTSIKVELPKAAHTLTKTEAKAATCTADGNVEYYTCSVCKKTFADAKGEKELAAADLVVKSEGHKLTKTAAKAATYTAEGNIEYYTCSVCGKLFADAEGAKAITAADTVIAKLPLVVIEKEEVETDKPETDAPETDAPETEDKEEVTVPEVKVEVKVEVQEEAAAEIIEKAVEEAKENDEAPVVVIDVKKEVVEAVQKEDATVKEEEIKVAEVSIPTATVEKVVEADEKATLAVNLTTATVIMDNKALETVAKEAEGKTVELKVDQVAVEELKEEQQAAVENKEVALTISATLICSETKKEIGKEAAGGFGGGTVTVAVPVPAKLPEGVKAADLQVYYVADDGTVTKIDSKLVDGNIVFDLEHFSEYVIAAEKPASPATGDSMSIALYGALAIMAVLGMGVVLKKKAF